MRTSTTAIRWSRFGSSVLGRCRLVFFFNDTATTEIYTLSLHDALPISVLPRWAPVPGVSLIDPGVWPPVDGSSIKTTWRSEEHTSELQSRQYLVCRLLLEKKKHSVAQRLLVDRKARRLTHSAAHYPPAD